MTDHQPQVTFRHRRDRRRITLDASSRQIAVYEAHPNWVREGDAPQTEMGEADVG